MKTSRRRVFRHRCRAFGGRFRPESGSEIRGPARASRGRGFGGDLFRGVPISVRAADLRFSSEKSGQIDDLDFGISAATFRGYATFRRRLFLVVYLPKTASEILGLARPAGSEVPVVISRSGRLRAYRRICDSSRTNRGMRRFGLRDFGITSSGEYAAVGC